ncbi:MAG: MFS transporter [Desulfarculus sp.]|nr:MFS transporter [Desulfarculus sp.]
MDFKALLLLIVGHLVVDTPQGALPALLPLLKQAHGLSYAQAGAIVMVMNLTSSVIQPLFGYLSDRWPLRWLLPVGLAVSGLGMALLGLATSYGLMLALVVVSGLGVASFHPEAFKAVLGSATTRKVVGVSWFMVGGNMGFVVGPLLAGAFCAWLGLAGTAVFALPGVLMSGLYLFTWPRLLALRTVEQAHGKPLSPQPLRGRLGALSMLITSVILRSWVHSGVTAFVPFYYVSVLGGQEVDAWRMLTTFLLAGVTGTALGAPLAEKVGPKRFFVLAVALTTPLLLWFLQARGVWVYVSLALAGAFLISTWSIIMVMAQQILPDRAGMASGLMVGFALGTGGIGAAVLGAVADRWGVTTVLYIVAGLPLLSALTGWLVPTVKPPARAAGQAPAAGVPDA